MPEDGDLDAVFAGLRTVARLYADGALTAPELVNAIFLRLGQERRFELGDAVVELLPASARGELQRVVAAALAPGASYVPWSFGSDPSQQGRDAWLDRMVPACRRLAAGFREALARASAPASGRAEPGAAADRAGGSGLRG